MIENILNNGICFENDDSLRRKVRISNLIALISVLVMTFYTPVYFFLDQKAGIFLNVSFWSISLFTFYLHHKHLYTAGFFIHSTAGYFYFIAGTLFYGPATNLHFYMLVMCMIVTVLFDNRKVVRFYLSFAILSFFGLVWWSYDHQPLASVKPGMETVELTTGYVNLFLLFVILSLFIFFFKDEMLRSRKRVLEQKAVIEEKNRDITDSIHYAGRIQAALLPGRESLQKLFPGSFLFFQPKDIVSGDFYWMFEDEESKFIAVGDCTGHGVPGALMSVLGINLLTEIIENKRIRNPSAILEELRSGIIYAFGKEGKSGQYKDGMDISIARIPKKGSVLSYSAANNAVYLVASGELQEWKADRQPAGYSHEMKPFSTHEITFNTGDTLILFTDGYADQFGGPKNKKFMYRAFKETLVKSLSSDSEKLLSDTFENWRGSYEQIDDICIAGIRL